MFKELKMISLKTNLITFILLFAVGCVGLWAEWGTIRTAVGGKSDLDELTAEQIHDAMYVEGTVWGIYDAYANTTKGTDVVSQEYIIPVGENEYMGMVVKPKYIAQCDALMDETWAYLYDEVDAITGQFKVKGTILSMSDDSWRYFREVLKEDGMEDMDLALRYYLVVDQYGGAETGEQIIAVAVWLVLWGIAFWILISTLTGRYQKDLKKYCEATGAESKVEQFYRNTAPIHNLRLSRDYILGTGEKTCFLPSDDLLWAYTYIEKRKKYGVITVSKHVSVKFCSKDGTQRQHAVGSEEQGHQILEQIHTVLPWVIVGYSDELAKTYRSDRQSMIKAVDERKLQSDSAFGL